jgi:hypothetical protein
VPLRVHWYSGIKTRDAIIRVGFHSSEITLQYNIQNAGEEKGGEISSLHFCTLYTRKSE